MQKETTWRHKASYNPIVSHGESPGGFVGLRRVKAPPAHLAEQQLRCSDQCQRLLRGLVSQRGGGSRCRIRVGYNVPFKLLFIS